MLVYWILPCPTAMAADRLGIDIRIFHCVTKLGQERTTPRTSLLLRVFTAIFFVLFWIGATANGAIFEIEEGAAFRKKTGSPSGPGF